MTAIDRRTFLAIGASTSAVGLPFETLAAPPQTKFADLLRDHLGLTPQTAEAMAVRGRRLIEQPAGLLTSGEVDGCVELLSAPRSKGVWKLRGVADSDALLGRAVAMACPATLARIGGNDASMRWFSGCTFGQATAHLFRTARTRLFLVTAAYAAERPPVRLDILLH